MFHDPKSFKFTQALEICQEYLAIETQLIDWYEKELYGEGWQVFGLFDFPHGNAIASHIQQAPVTASIIEKYIPHHGAAGFSLLKPQTKIKPHQGYQGNFLRCHLGLKIPSGDCGLQVKNEVRYWQEGKVIIFDDRIVHQAWNLTTENRVILLIDFEIK